MSTFSKLRVGKKPYAAGCAMLTLAVAADVAEVVGTLPPGASILNGVGTKALITATVSDGTTTATLAAAVANTPDTSDDVSEIAGPGEIEITVAGAAGAILLITYVLNDDLNGVNA